jgi:hypothetical protein
MAIIIGPLITGQGNTCLSLKDIKNIATEDSRRRKAVLSREDAKAEEVARLGAATDRRCKAEQELIRQQELAVKQRLAVRLEDTSEEIKERATRLLQIQKQDAIDAEAKETRRKAAEKLFDLDQDSIHQYKEFLRQEDIHKLQRVEASRRGFLQATVDNIYRLLNTDVLLYDLKVCKPTNVEKERICQELDRLAVRVDLLKAKFVTDIPNEIPTKGALC